MLTRTDVEPQFDVNQLHQSSRLPCRRPRATLALPAWMPVGVSGLYRLWLARGPRPTGVGRERLLEILRPQQLTRPLSSARPARVPLHDA
jgi:hypothetical protein